MALLRSEDVRRALTRFGDDGRSWRSGYGCYAADCYGIAKIVPGSTVQSSQLGGLRHGWSFIWRRSTGTNPPKRIPEPVVKAAWDSKEILNLFIHMSVVNADAV